MYADNNGVKIWFEIHGQGEPALIMVPGLQISHSEHFKQAFVPACHATSGSSRWIFEAPEDRIAPKRDTIWRRTPKIFTR